MEGLGRAINVVPIAASAGLAMKGATGVTFICTGNDTFTLTAAPSFAGSYTSPGNIIVRKYTNTSTANTAKWVLATQTAAAAVTISSGSVAFFVSADSLPDLATYVKVTPSGSGLVTAVFHDLTVKRSADKLAIISA
jgi:hypothetical protein